MSLWSSALVSLVVLLCAAGLMIGHVRSWRASQAREHDAATRDYHRRQFRRRVQTTAMLGLVGVSLFVGQLIHALSAPPLVLLCFWGGVLLVLGWISLLALADVLATKHHFGRLRQDFLIEQAKLQAELRRLQVARGNGKAAGRKGEG